MLLITPVSPRFLRTESAQGLAFGCLLHVLAVGSAWWHVSGHLFLNAQPGGRAVALGRLAGLLFGSAVLFQVVLISRWPWLEPSVGCDRLFRLHRCVGFAIGPLLLGHPALLVFGYARRHHISVGEQLTEITGAWPYVSLAIAAIAIIIPTFVLSLPVIRRRLRYETWHGGHLAMYAAVGLASLHQLNGAELSAGAWFTAYWVALHVVVIGGFVVFRAGRPALSFARHRFRIEKLVPESDDVTSVYLTGRRLDRFSFRPGQYANVAFLSKRRWAPHPFSFSAAPNGRFLRLSIKSAGDFTDRVRTLAPGTFAVIEGPLGAFTANPATRTKYLMVAGGIGITPIRALVESLSGARRDVVLLYSVKTAADLVFASELRASTTQCHFILSQSPATSDGHEHGRIDRLTLARLVPDIQEREVFVCGPPPMMTAVVGALRSLQVGASQIHLERFS